MPNKKFYKCKNVYPATPEYFHRNKAQRDGLSVECKICGNKRRRKDYYNDKESWLKKLRIRNWKVKYNITPKEREKLYINQNGKCAICSTPWDYIKINTDHNHKTGKVRGLLCPKCNLGVGYLDNKNWHNNALKYLKETE